LQSALGRRGAIDLAAETDQLRDLGELAPSRRRVRLAQQDTPDLDRRCELWINTRVVHRVPCRDPMLARTSPRRLVRAVAALATTLAAVAQVVGTVEKRHNRHVLVVLGHKT
jgi:hypothetical protein